MSIKTYNPSLAPTIPKFFLTIWDALFASREIVNFYRDGNNFYWHLLGLNFVHMTSLQYQQYCEDLAEYEAEFAGKLAPVSVVI